MWINCSYRWRAGHLDPQTARQSDESATVFAVHLRRRQSVDPRPAVVGPPQLHADLHWGRVLRGLRRGREHRRGYSVLVECRTIRGLRYGSGIEPGPVFAMLNNKFKLNIYYNNNIKKQGTQRLPKKDKTSFRKILDSTRCRYYSSGEITSVGLRKFREISFFPNIQEFIHSEMKTIMEKYFYTTK